MITAIYTHSDCLEYETGSGHPESPQRLKAVLDSLKELSNTDAETRLIWEDAPLVSRDDLERAHKKTYLDWLENKNKELGAKGAIIKIDEDTRLSTGSLTAAKRSAGAVCQAVEDIISEKYNTAFCATRPPGHHALKDSSMGFCLFGNVAIAALKALSFPEIKKVAIVDFDVHQGNGTQNIIQGRQDILFYSLHQTPLWPDEHEDPKNPADPIQNISMPPLADVQEYRELFQNNVIRGIEKFSPDLILISAGFDAHIDDPPKGETLLNDAPGRQNLTEEDFDWMTQELHALSVKHGQGRLISVLEGGYSPDILAKCARSHVRTLMECTEMSQNRATG